MSNVIPFARTPPLDNSPASSPLAEPSRHRDDDEQWAQWMLQAQDGDRRAYHALLQSITPYVRAIARRYLGSGEDTEDAVQEILLVIHTIRHTFERGRPFKPWLGTIASRRCIDLLRRRTHRLRHEIEDEEQVDSTAGGTRGPDDATAELQRAREIRDAVDALPDRQRDAIHLLRLRELSLNEAAEHSHQSVGSLKVACHRAIKSLKRTFAPKGHPHE